MKKVLIIEDEPGVQMTLEDRFNSENYSVTIKDNGITGEEEAKSGNYDIILLDVMLPDRDGFAVCKNLRTYGVKTPILMLTARNTDLDIVIGLREGADDYLAKPFTMSVLMARVEALIRRSSISEHDDSGIVVEFSDFTLNEKKGELFRDNQQIPLNTLEYKLLLFLARNKNSVVSRDKILDKVWGYETETSSRTVDVHIAKLRYKLGESDFPKHIQTIRGRGYKFLP